MLTFCTKKLVSNKFLMQLGTLSGNPIASVAGLKTMEILKKENLHSKMLKDGKRLMNLFKSKLYKIDVDYRVVGHETLFDIIFINKKIENYRDYISANMNIYTKFNNALRRSGFFKPPGKIYVSAVLREEDFELAEKSISCAVAQISAA